MNPYLLVFCAVLAPLAAARSTWSPCGLSMLSSITPFGERSRRHRYWVTSAWFVAGATAGGLTLGGAAAAAATAARVAGLGRHPGLALAIAGALCASAALLDAGAFGAVLPLIRRQVDDAWLSRYRPWFYGAGFGWQIGVGLATYLMTAGVVLLAVASALGASPLGALAVCGLFGFCRGSTVLLTAGAGTPGQLRSLHARLDRAGPAVKWAVICVEAAGAVAMCGQSEGGVLTLGIAVVAGALGLHSRRRQALPSGLTGS